MKTLHHKKNELFEVEFFQDKECTIPFDFTNAKDLYIGSKDGDATPLLSLYKRAPINRTLPMIVWTPYLPDHTSIITEDYIRIRTLEWITPNFSKYIPEDNAVLFLSEEDVIFQPKAGKGLVWKSITYSCHKGNGIYRFREIPYPDVYETLEDLKNRVISKKLTIFLPHGTQTELQKANEVAKELKEKYGVEEVNLFTLHCFIKYDVLHYEILNIDESDYFNKTPEEAFEYIQNTLYSDDEDFVEKYIKEYDDEFREDFEKKKNDFFKSLLLNKIITTNSTGVLKPEDSNERLQVIDCKEIFEDFLNGNN